MKNNIGGARFCLWVLVICMALIPESIMAACPKCFGAQVDTPVTQGIGLAMLGMVGITGMVLSSIVAFFLYMKRRADKLRSGKYVVSDQGVILPLPERLFDKQNHS